jgi:hypothetical protein
MISSATSENVLLSVVECHLRGTVEHENAAVCVDGDNRVERRVDMA